MFLDHANRLREGVLFSFDTEWAETQKHVGCFVSDQTGSYTHKELLLSKIWELQYCLHCAKRITTTTTKNHTRRILKDFYLITFCFLTWKSSVVLLEMAKVTETHCGPWTAKGHQ